MKLKCYGELCLKNNIKHDKSELVKYKNASGRRKTINV